MRELLRAAWARWKTIAEAIARFQARLLFTILYVVVVAPFAIGVRVLADPLELRRGTGTRWRSLARQSATLEAARRQF
jgi:hypothetical protein